MNTIPLTSKNKPKISMKLLGIILNIPNNQNTIPTNISNTPNNLIIIFIINLLILFLSLSLPYNPVFIKLMVMNKLLYTEIIKRTCPGSSAGLEHFPPKEGVAGSSPALGVF